jgi:hypothetical protein
LFSARIDLLLEAVVRVLSLGVIKGGAVKSSLLKGALLDAVGFITTAEAQDESGEGG